MRADAIEYAIHDLEQRQAEMTLEQTEIAITLKVLRRMIAPAAAPAPVAEPVPQEVAAPAPRRLELPAGGTLQHRDARAPQASTSGRTRVTPSESESLASRLLQSLSTDGHQSTVAIAARVKFSRHTVKALLDSMARKGLVHSEGRTQQQRWYLGAKGASRPAPAKEAP